MTGDGRRILAAQALRALAYGFGSVLLGASLEERGFGPLRAGAFLTAIVAGNALVSLAIGAFGDRLGRRRVYAALFLLLGASGAGIALTDRLWLLVPIALAGALSTEVIESGPFTSLEQPMLAAGSPAGRRARVFGTYNAVATIAGSLGALAAGGPSALRSVWSAIPPDHRFFLAFVPIGIAGAAVAVSLSDAVETRRPQAGAAAGDRPLMRSRGRVVRLSALFAADSFGGGFVVQAFLVFWFRDRFGASTELLGAVFFAVGMLQAVSFAVAGRLAERVGLLRTMVFTHLPSNVLLAAIPLAPNLGTGIGLLLARHLLSQMDVPARQAYVMAMVEPPERTAAAAYTNTARLVVRPLGPVLAGATQRIADGLPFFLAGGIKAAYDVVLWLWFRRIPPASDEPSQEERS